MALNLDGVGKKIGPFKKSYTWKEPVLYALGVGAGFSDLEFCYEKDLKVLPSFGIVTLYDFMPDLAAESNVNLAGVLHGEQELIFYNPIPTEGTLITEGSITHYYDKGKGKGALIVAEFDTHHSNGQKLFTSVVTVFARLDGGFGGPEAPKKETSIPDRAPDIEVSASPSDDQPLIYRLSGDIFALHVDTEFARMAGFEKPIMHGLCTHGYAGRALIQNLVPGQPEKVRRMVCRFRSPLYPGTPFKTQIWKEGEGKALWRVVNASTGETVIDNGFFEYGDIPKEEFRFDDRVAVVTGAGAGLGRVYALELAKRGAKVVVNDLGGPRDGTGEGSTRAADLVVEEIKALGGEAVANYDSVSHPEGGEAIIRTAVEAFGRVDILINNAGILRDKTLARMEPENWQGIMDVHLNGAYYVTRPAFLKMRENGYGRIIMTTSAAGLFGNFGQANYSAAKMGLVGFMNTLKLEGEKHNIKVNTVAPIAATRLTEDVLPPDLFEKLKPEFVAPLVLYLCSEQCPVNGAIYNAGAGFFNRAAIVSGPGTIIGQGQEIPTPEAVADHWNQVIALTGVKEYASATIALGDLLAGPPAQADEPGTGTGPTLSVQGIFEQMPKAFQTDKAAGVSVIFQYRISGPKGGDWHTTIKDGTCQVSQGLHNSPTTTIKMGDDDFLALMEGKLKAMQAYTSGKLKIEGDLMKSQLIEKLFKF
ncbi:MAG: SDR family NAD(P)-dependent oxidoreductase [Deltaproteobacteria bacterium]|nr:SDR family NAD(P)-dependent oxidoreductase [Deltaproteobacteria bacterium]